MQDCKDSGGLEYMKFDLLTSGQETNLPDYCKILSYLAVVLSV